MPKNQKLKTFDFFFFTQYKKQNKQDKVLILGKEYINKNAFLRYKKKTITFNKAEINKIVESK